MFKYLVILLGVCCVPFMLKAGIRNQIGISGIWYVYGFALYQPIDRVATPAVGMRQEKFEPGFTYGVGIGKDHVRIEISKYLNCPRFLAAFDVFPTSVATPYIGFINSRGLRSTDNSSVLKTYVTRGELVAGITFQPISFVNIYVEYLTRDHFFFGGMRIKLPYKVN